MNLSTQMATDTAGIIGSGGEFSEAVTYTPYGGSAKTIYAIVERSPLDRLAETQQSISDSLEVTVRRADVAVVKRDGDTIAVAPNLGGEVKTFTVRQIVRQDSAVFVLRVR